MQPLPRDVASLDFLSTQEDPGHFLGNARAMLMRRSRVRGREVVIRLGRTGAGRYPNYKLEDAATGELVAAYGGGDHRPYEPFDDYTVKPTSWSEVAMTQGDLEDLMRELRARFKP